MMTLLAEATSQPCQSRRETSTVDKIVSAQDK